MPNLRVISDNAIDRASLSAAATATNFAVASLQSARKSDVWRSASTSANLAATWSTPEPIQAVVLPFCNLSPTATMRVRVTSEAQATNLQINSETGTGWVANGTTPPTVTNGVTFLGVPAVKVDFTSAMTPSYAGSRAERTGMTVPVTVGPVYAVSSFLCLSRALTGGESITVYATGASGTPSTALTAANCAGFVGSYGRITCAPGVMINPGTIYFVVYLSNTLTAPLTVYLTRHQMELNTVTSYYPTTTAAATRPLGYIDSWQSYTYDSGAPLACPAPAQTLRGFTAAQAASAYAFGGGAHGRLWLPSSINAYGLAVDIVDTGNLQGYVECAFLAAGPYWESATNFDYGASATLIDSTKNDRNDAGDLISDAGTVSKKLSLQLSKLSAADRASLWGILRSSGLRYPLFLSMFPGNADLALERDHQVYGKLVQLPAMALPFFNLASATVEVESI